MRLEKTPNAFGENTKCVWRKHQMHLEKTPNAFGVFSRTSPEITKQRLQNRDYERNYKQKLQTEITNRTTTPTLHPVVVLLPYCFFSNFFLFLKHKKKSHELK